MIYNNSIGQCGQRGYQGECAYSNEHMLLNSERTRIDFDTEYCDVGKPSSSSPTHREGQQLSHDSADADRRESEEEKLIETGNDDGPRQSNSPSAEGRDGHVEVVGVCYRRSHFWVRTLVVESNKMLFVQIRVVECGTSNFLAMT